MLDLLERHSTNDNNESNLLNSNISNVGVKLAKLKTSNTRSSEFGNQIKNIKTKIKKGLAIN